MTPARPILAALALASCAPEQTLRQVEADAVTNFVGNTCTPDRDMTQCLASCKAMFSEAPVHRDACIRIVTGKFTGEA